MYYSGPPALVQAPKRLKFVDTTEMLYGPQDLSGYWVVSGHETSHGEGKDISLLVWCSHVAAILPVDEDLLDDEF